MRSLVAKIFLCALFLPFGMYSLVWGFIHVVRADFFSALVAIGVAAFCLGFVAMLAVAGNESIQPRVETVSDGLLLRPDRRVDGSLIVSNFGAFIGMVTYAVCTPLDLLNVPAPRDDERYFLLACAVAIPIGLFTLTQIIRRGGVSYLRVSEAGLEMGSTITSVRRDWDEVMDIADRPAQGRHSTGTTYIRTGDGHTREVPTDWYTPQGHALRELIRFYWQHPDTRHELTDGSAVRRLDTELRGLR